MGVTHILKRTEVYDIETYKPVFLYMGMDISTKEWYCFEISQYKNELDGLVKHLKDSCIEYAISFNGIGYDAQILQYILDNADNWVDLTNLEIVKKIRRFSDKVIDDGKYDLYPPYREEEFELQQIDLFKIHHFDNENRRTSLKWLQFSMDWWSVEETPISFDQEAFTKEEIIKVKGYCKNDIESTYQFYLWTIGETENELYKGQNKIQDRLDLIEEMGFPMTALSWSDVRMGDEINKKVYMQLSGITDPRKLIELKMNRTPRKNFTYKDCIPKYVSFRTPEFKGFFDRMKKVRVNLNEKEEFPFTYNGTTYNIAKGGIHSNESNRIITPKPHEILMDADVGSQYPHSLIKRQLYPSHLGKAWLVGYTGTRDKRMEYKGRIAESRKYKSLSDSYKLAVNGGFGKTNERTNWQYDPFVHFSCTIGNQFEILMLIESLELEGIHVVSANTDGIVCLFDRKLIPTYERVCRKWELIVGNSEQGKLEYTEYTKMVQMHVNSYIAVTVKGKIKKKSAFATDREINKNKSRRVIPIALEEYFIYGVPVEETIKKHDRIFDFCIGVKASKEYHYETVDKKGNKEVYHRLVRHFVSKDGGKLLKIKNPNSEAKGNDVMQCEAGIWKSTVANDIDVNKKIDSYNVNYDYYIEKATEIIINIERGKKGGPPPDKNQLNLF